MLRPPFLPETRKHRAGRRACCLTLFGLRHGAEPGDQRYVFLTSRLDCAFCSPASSAGLFCCQGLRPISAGLPYACRFHVRARYKEPRHGHPATPHLTVLLATHGAVAALAHSRHGRTDRLEAGPWHGGSTQGAL